MGKKRLRRIRSRQDFLGKPSSESEETSAKENYEENKFDENEEHENQKTAEKEQKKVDKPEPKPKKKFEYKNRGNKFLDFYDKNYKKLLIIPMLILILAICQISYQYATTGDIMNKGVSLKGGITITVSSPDKEIDIIELENFLKSEFPKYDTNTRAITSLGKPVGVLIEADAKNEDEGQLFVVAISRHTGIQESDMGIDLVDSSLGSSFFQQTFRALFAAYIFVSLIVFIYFADKSVSWLVKIPLIIVGFISGFTLIFSSSWLVLPLAIFVMAAMIYFFIRYSIPSLAIILAGISTIIETLAVVNLLEIKVTTAGIAGFLMLIGYSIDTDILLTVRVLKRKGGDVFTRVMGAVKTGLTMNCATIAAVTVGLIISQSAVITQIMLVILIGMVFDIINTWIQNVAILRMYMKGKGEE